MICADTASDDPITLAGLIARDRANVVALGAVGLNIPRRIYFEKELNFINSRSYGPGRYDPAYEEGGVDYPIGYVRWTEGRNLEAIVELIASGALDVKTLISHRYPIEEAPQAYDLITGKQPAPFLGVLLTYGNAETNLKAEASKETSLNTQYAKRNTQYAIRNTQPTIPASPPTSIKLSILGAGNFASAVMLPALKGVKHIELVGIASGSGLSAAHAAQKFGFRYAAESLEQILADPEVNTVAILTRHDLHASQALASLKAGLHVFVEKPLALNPDQLSEIREVLESSGKSLLMTGFNRRFAPLAQEMVAFLNDRSEPLAASYRVNAGFIPLTHWLHDPEIGGGRIIGEGCHFVDFLTFLVGEPPISVTAHGLPDSGRYREDNVVLTFTYPDGSVGTLSYLANGDKAFPKERIEVFSGGRVAVLDDFRSLEMAHHGRRRTFRSRLRQDKGHQAEWLAFRDAILGGGDAPIPYQHLFGVTAATFAAVEALRSGEKVLIVAD